MPFHGLFIHLLSRVLRICTANKACVLQGIEFGRNLVSNQGELISGSNCHNRLPYPLVARHVSSASSDRLAIAAVHGKTPGNQSRLHTRGTITPVDMHTDGGLRAKGENLDKVTGVTVPLIRLGSKTSLTEKKSSAVSRLDYC